jgi:hypothetical protein
MILIKKGLTYTTYRDKITWRNKKKIDERLKMLCKVCRLTNDLGQAKFNWNIFYLFLRLRFTIVQVEIACDDYVFNTRIKSLTYSFINFW